MDFPVQEVAFQVYVQTMDFSEAGYDWIDVSTEGVANDDDILVLKEELPVGEYLAFGVCDSDCGDIDLFVYSENGEEIGSDTLDDSYPVVEFSVHVEQPITAGTVIYSCEIEPCYQGIVILGED